MTKVNFGIFSTSTACIALMISGCAAIPTSGPSAGAVRKVGEKRDAASAGISVVDVTDEVARRILDSDHQVLFSDVLGDGQPIGSAIGIGDILDIAIWEAPPAALFGAVGGGAQFSSSNSAAQLSTLGATAKGNSLPEQMVDGKGQVVVPFVGHVQAAGLTPQEVAQSINARLVGKAHQPQTIVRVVRNAASNVTVVGDVVDSMRVPLSSRGERLLDILASAGGVKQPVNKMMVQITRGKSVSSMPLETVIRDPRQNIRLRPDDVMTLMFQPFSFTALGAVGRNGETPFEGTGLTLAQALGRVSGLEDARSDVKGVFVFRLERPSALSPEILKTARTTPDGRVPVIYRINMRDPSIFFVAQGFPIRDKDVLYVSNAPLADFQKFLGAIFSTISPAITTAAVAGQSGL